MHFLRKNSVFFRTPAIGTYEGRKETRETDIDSAGKTYPMHQTTQLLHARCVADPHCVYEYSNPLSHDVSNSRVVRSLKPALDELMMMSRPHRAQPKKTMAKVHSTVGVLGRPLGSVGVVW